MTAVERKVSFRSMHNFELFRYYGEIDNFKFRSSALLSTCTSVFASTFSAPSYTDLFRPLVLASLRGPLLDLSSSFRKAIIPALPTSATRLKALEIKGSLFMTDKNPSEIESLLIDYPDGLTELSLTCHWRDVPSTVLNIIAPWPSLRSLTLKLGLKKVSSPASTWSLFLTSLAHTNAKLEHIILLKKSDYEYLSPSSFDFYPLLAHQSLTRLDTLVLSPDRTTSITLTDADILTLATTCPHLHILAWGCRIPPYHCMPWIPLLGAVMRGSMRSEMVRMQMTKTK
ncbi:hypothetical protein BDR07DRAFT_1457659 [Suillus spraguei]|nr:hypothetical protein BDR07DRAFT_1457659 [Suillus spraguei]